MSDGDGVEDSRDTSKDYRVRNDSLRNLVEKWRDEIEPVAGDREYQARNRTLANCADELEEVIEDAE